MQDHSFRLQCCRTVGVLNVTRSIPPNNSSRLHVHQKKGGTISPRFHKQVPKHVRHGPDVLKLSQTQSNVEQSYPVNRPLRYFVENISPENGMSEYI